MDTSPPADGARELLRGYLVGRGRTVAQLAAALGEDSDLVSSRLTGDAPVALDWVERVLAELGVPPAEFFGRLYGGGAIGDGSGTGSSGAPDSLSRAEVEALVEEARGLIRGTVRMLDARDRAERERSGD